MNLAHVHALIVAALLAPGLSAQTPRDIAPAPSSPPSALSGPKLPAKSQRPSLVRREMNGHLKRLELFPAQAAIEIMELDAGTRERIAKILASRTAILDGVVRDHLNLLVELFSAGQAGDGPEAARIGLVFAQKLTPLSRRGAIETELAGALPESLRDTLHRLVREYEDALVAEATPNPEGKVPSRFEVLSGEALRLWGEQIRLSFERQAATGEIFFERIIRELHLRPEQEARTRDRVQRYVEETKLNPTKEQEKQFGMELVAWLDPAQVTKLIQLIKQAEGMMKPKPRPDPTAEPSALKSPPEAKPGTPKK